MLGARGVDILTFESFGEGWATDIVKHLKLQDARVLSAPYGQAARPGRGRSGERRRVYLERHHLGRARCRTPTGSPADRQGLAICDATSAAFAMALPWDKLDVVTWSWQKVLGGEAAHGMLALSPRAVERLETYTPPWPLPKLFRLTSKGKIAEGMFKGETINTPSMLCVEDAVDGLRWAERIGGLPALIARSEANLAADRRAGSRAADWAGFLAEDPATRSCTSICLKITAPWFTALPAEGQAKAAKQLASLLDKQGVAYDIGAYRDAPPGLRIWAGATVETADIGRCCRGSTGPLPRSPPHSRLPSNDPSRTYQCPKF